MYTLILHGRNSLKLQNLRNLRFAAQNQNPFFAFSNSFSSAADVSPFEDGRKGQNFTVSYLVDSLGLTTKLAESISRKVSFESKANPDSILSLLRSHGFTDSQISDIVTDYPLLLTSDAEKSLAPKLKFLQSRGASSSELTEIVSKVPKILGKRVGRSISVYYDFVKDIVEADKSSREYEKSCHSWPEGMRANKIRNVLVLRDLGVPMRFLFPLLISESQPICGRERFDKTLKKVVEMGFDPKTSRFVEALKVLYQLSDKTVEEKLSILDKRLGFAVGDVWEIFKKSPICLALSEQKIQSSIETYLGLGFSEDELAIMVKRSASCLNYTAETVKKKTEFLVKEMNWPLKSVALFPQVLGLNMEKRVVPRCNVIKALMSKGLIGKGSELPSMASVLAVTDEAFLKRYVMKQEDKKLVAVLMSIFTRDCVS
ncbi:unnamed protein product [Microthlaspi erraticum]|uniref:Uncharacterized protein n=1 Tax=Microthlaspi erraticum TaxID=1685480 RepID=A0A6D2IWM3_9BRAS|nr:unnamed protein product [Microthlaspi erraticum]CAA7029853.1 unnamed protein product [Microthlaspi erraticum]CAA7046693.1 unnamed protein product [Microthlaspi erraticum]